MKKGAPHYIKSIKPVNKNFPRFFKALKRLAPKRGASIALDQIFGTKQDSVSHKSLVCRYWVQPPRWSNVSIWATLVRNTRIFEKPFFLAETSQFSYIHRILKSAFLFHLK